MRIVRKAVPLVAAMFASNVLDAQQASLTYRLGRDTVAIEQWTRTATSLDGESVNRTGAEVRLTRYSIAFGQDGRPTRVSFKRFSQAGLPLTTEAQEYRFSISADSIVRETVLAGGVQRRAFAAKGAVVNFPNFVYGPTELLAARRRTGGADSLPAINPIANDLGFTGLAAVPGGGSTYRLMGTGFPMLLTFDAHDQLQAVDGMSTTSKSVATRGPGGLDIAAIARDMKPMGALSARADARASFFRGGMVVVDYGRPHVRERSVWGGTLIPLDTVWRAGANEATHLFTTHAITFGRTTLAAGSYTLWVQHAASGTFLIINRQVGQWGTRYEALHDVARVPMTMRTLPEHVEEFTITVQALDSARGRLELAWADKAASVQFELTPGRP